MPSPGSGGSGLSVPIFCVRCGYPNVQGYAYCPNCGNPVYTPPPAAAPAAAGAPPPASPSAPYGPAPPYANLYPAPYGYQYYGPPPKRATVSRMLEDTFHLFGADILTYLGVYLAVGLINVGATLLLTWLGFGVPSVTSTPSGTFGLSAADLILRTVLVILALGLLSAVIGAIVISSVTHFAVQRYRGTAERLEEAFAHGLRRFLSVLGAQLLLLLITAGAFTIPFAFLVIGALTRDIPLILLAAFLLVVLGIVAIYLTIAFLLYVPAIVMEGQSALGGLKRSWDLTRGHRLDLFLTLLILGAIIGAITFAISFGFTLSGNAYLAAAGSVLAGALTGSWLVLLASVAYQLISTEPPLYYGAPPPYAYPPPVPPR